LTSAALTDQISQAYASHLGNIPFNARPIYMDPIYQLAF